MKRENLAIVISFFAFAFWLAENFYFGWNHQVDSLEEYVSGGLVIFLFFLSYLVKPSSNETNITIFQSDVELNGLSLPKKGKKK